MRRPGRRAEGVPGDREGAGDQPRSSGGLSGARAIVWNVRNGFQHDRAIVDLKRAVANNPSLAEAYVELGKVYYHIGMTDESIAANDEALRLDPLATVAARRRFNALFDARRFDEVREILGRNPRWLAPSLRAEALLMMDEVPTALAALTAPAAGGGQDSGSVTWSSTILRCWLTRMPKRAGAATHSERSPR